MKSTGRITKLLLCLTLAASCLLSCSAKNEKASVLDPENPTTVTIWNYYNGDQLAAFDTLVREFNNTIGQEQGIIVVSESQGSIDTLASSLIDAVDGKVGAPDIPSAAAIYPETTYILNNKDMIVPLDEYFTESELAEYIKGFIDEGHLTKNGKLLILPVSKSTEAFIINKTDWQQFSDASGVTADSIKTCNDLTLAAEKYYNWTDSLTPDINEDGKALYGRDSIANYIYIGAKQLGHELFVVRDDGTVEIDMDKETFRTLWDNYYIPFINGYFAADSKFRSEDFKTGTIISMTCSTSGITYINPFVTNSDDTKHDIEISISKSLCFAEGKDVSVQQGAGFCIMKTTEAEQYAASEFLKWFTDVEQNLNFSIQSGYSPVKIEANNVDKIKSVLTVDSAKTQNLLNTLIVSAEVYKNGQTYSSPAFTGSKDVRTILDNSLNDICIKDRTAVVEAIKSGKTREEAVLTFESDDYFNSWYDALCVSVKAIVS